MSKLKPDMKIILKRFKIISMRGNPKKFQVWGKKKRSKKTLKDNSVGIHETNALVCLG